jgi:hypothetical protein
MAATILLHAAIPFSVGRKMVFLASTILPPFALSLGADFNGIDHLCHKMKLDMVAYSFKQPFAFHLGRRIVLISAR